MLLLEVDKSSESVYAAPVTRKRTDLLQVPEVPTMTTTTPRTKLVDAFFLQFFHFFFHFLYYYDYY